MVRLFPFVWTGIPSPHNGTLWLSHQTCCVPRNSPCPLHHARSTQLSWWSRVPLPSVFLLEKGASSSTPLSAVSGAVRFPAEVEPRRTLEHQAALHAVTLATND